jgi:hypothetical protein
MEISLGVVVEVGAYHFGGICDNCCHSFFGDGFRFLDIDVGMSLWGSLSSNRAVVILFRQTGAFEIR